MIALRDVDEGDLEVFFEHQREPEANHMAAFPPRDRERFMTHWRTVVLASATTTTKTIVFGDEVAGNIESWEHDGKRLVGYWIGQAYWGRGIATAALRAFLDEHEPARPLYAYVATHNAASSRVLEKCGFAPMGPPSPGHDGVHELLMRLES
jgi:RimJ/RimL family protein N-acetyltransferase